MAKAEKRKAAPKKRGTYDEPLKVNGSLSDILNAAVKHRAKNIPANKKS